MKSCCKKSKNSIIPISILFICFASNLATAEEVNKLEKIVVSSGSQEERRKNAEEMFLKPYSKQIVGEKTISEESIIDIAEAVRDIPGVSVTENGAFTKSIKVRGLEGPRISSLINGIKLGNQGMTHTGAGEMGTQEIANVKLIEVIKGSPSVIYDPGASGGVVNVITHSSPEEKGVGFKQKISYDQGYDLKKSTTILEASTGKVGGMISYTKAQSNDYKMVGDKGKEFIIEKVNDLSNESSISIPVENLGYKTDNLTIDLNIKAGDDGIIDFKWNDWVGKDMSIIHGSTIYDAGIIQYDKMTKNTKMISYRKDKLGKLSDVNILYATTKQYQHIGIGGSGVRLNSKQFNFISDYIGNNYILKFGGENRTDDAKTLVYSKEDYYGAFINGEYLLDKWAFFAGIRYNYWNTQQRLLDGTNKEVAGQLVGISGDTPSKTKSAPTMAVGVQYMINDSNNLSLNLNTTYRNPDLMEKYSFGGVLGGGIGLKPEEGEHAELSWKYLDETISYTSSIFYSKFKNYIWKKDIRNLKNKTALIECIQMGDCDPTKGEYDDRESDFFDIYRKYYNSENVTNWGIELNLQYSIPGHEIIASSSFNDIKSDDKFVKSAGQPIDSSVSYRYEFNNGWKPWVKIKGQYVLDTPEVEQHKGFNPYFVAHTYFGFSKNNFIINGGVRNILNKEYHVAYSGINSLSRTLFVNVAYNWNK